MKKTGAGRLATSLLLLASVAGAAAASDAAAAPDGKQAFEKLKALAGDWHGTGSGEGVASMPAEVRYAVTAGGNAVSETLFPGTPHEMVTMYTLDGGDLVAVHYCASGNHPRLKYDPAASGADRLVFGFAGATNFDAAKDTHIHDARYQLGGDHLEAEWSSWAGSKPGDTIKVSVERKKS